jgi:hypothetical protein
MAIARIALSRRRRTDGISPFAEAAVSKGDPRET